ncbi:MAG: hypothetical protein GVY06_05810 [Alphaproteobacteria bacterium]|jgi:hypothetical protein|nr:hypothetical protein [Alphaproteobacteria bacterium]
MSDDSAPERDAAGRFVKPHTPDPDTPGNDSTHPAAQAIFGWVSHPRTPALLLAAVIALTLILVMMDGLVAGPGEVGFDTLTGFHALVGFATILAVAFAAWPLGALLRRSPDYYGDTDTVPGDTAEHVEGGQ